MGLSKLRPVGSRVPLPVSVYSISGTPWSERYDSIFVNSGTAALSLAVKLSVRNRRISQSPEVILPAYGCPDLIAAVVAQGARPVLVDLTQGRPWMNLEAVENAVTDNTVAIIAAGFLGIPERLFALRAIADRNHVALIEDSAQVFPPYSCSNGLADYLVLSFGRGKPINLMGGGALLIRKDHSGEIALNSPGLLETLPEVNMSVGAAWRFRRRVFNLLLTRPLYGLMERIPFLGIGQTVFHPLASIERRMPVEGLLEAGIEEFNSRNDKSADYSDVLKALGERGWVQLAPECLKEAILGGPVPSPSLLLRYPLLAPTRGIRDRALLELNHLGLGASAFYGAPLAAIDGVSGQLSVTAEAFPCARDFADRLITLPTHEDVCIGDIKTAAETLLRQG